MLTTICAVPPRYDVVPHRSVVSDVQDAQLHATASSSDVVGVGSFELKFSPKSVTETPALSARLCKTFVRTGPAQARYVWRVRPADAFAACAPS